jgi:hypothetical protein
MTKIIEALAICDGVECGYRIVELADERVAFVWGNIAAKAGDSLDVESLLEKSTDEKGISVHDSYADAEKAWIDCGIALYQGGGERAAKEMLYTILSSMNEVDSVLA